MTGTPRHAETGRVHEAPDREQLLVGQVIYEPFSGPGTTTIIAAEMMRRSCHAIQVMPQYVDVAVEKNVRKHYQEELGLGKTIANARSPGFLFKYTRTGNVTAQIFWPNTRARWRETRRR